MRRVSISLWALLALLSALWLAAEPSVFQPQGFFALRNAMVQYSGILAMGAMSAAMVLALRPRWPERWFDGLDKMYRLHKWLGIAAMVLAIAHWLWAQGPKWAVDWGWLQRPHRGPRAGAENPIAQVFMDLRGTAEWIGEWVFYAAVLLIVLALVKRFPYRLFFKTHRLLAVVYLALVFHVVVLTRFTYWTSPIGIVMAALLALGTWAAVVVLLRRVAADRKVPGKIRSLHYYPGVHVLEAEIEVAKGWPGHRAGQFAFATTDVAEGAHPYTIASAWNAADRRITFVVKELGDHTRRLRQNCVSART